MLNSKQLLAALMSCATTQLAAAGDLPRGIVYQLPKGYEVLTFASGDLNLDKREDYLVALGRRDEEKFAHAEDAPRRPLLLFTQSNDGKFRLAARNDYVIFRINDGGQCDPFMDGEEGLVVKGTYFTVQNSVACGKHWTDFYTFRYDKQSDQWIFHREDFESWRLNNSSDPEADALVLETRSVKKGKKKSPIAFQDFRPD